MFLRYSKGISNPGVNSQHCQQSRPENESRFACPSFPQVLTKVHVETDQISNNVLTVHTDRTDAETRECSTFNNGNIYIFITFFLAVSCNANRTTMKIAIVSLITLMASSASAFAPASFTRGVSTQIYSDPEEEDGDGFDLNLEEMFDM